MMIATAGLLQENIEEVAERVDEVVLPTTSAALVETPVILIETPVETTSQFEIPSIGVASIPQEQPYHDHWDDNWYALLAELHVQEQRKKDKWHGEDDTDDWLAKFEKLALLELKK